jgi:hypothetical protein
MATKQEVIARLMQRAESKFGFKFAYDLDQALRTGAPGHREMLRKVLAQ